MLAPRSQAVEVAGAGTSVRALDLDYRLTALSDITVEQLSAALLSGREFDLDFEQKSYVSNGTTYYYFVDKYDNEWAFSDDSDAVPAISGISAVVYHLADSILPDGFHGDDYLFGQGQTQALRVSLYQLSGAAPDSPEGQLIDFITDPLGTIRYLVASGVEEALPGIGEDLVNYPQAMIQLLVASGVDTALPGAGDFVLDPMGTAFRTSVRLAGDAAKAGTGNDDADDFVENIFLNVLTKVGPGQQPAPPAPEETEPEGTGGGDAGTRTDGTDGVLASRSAFSGDQSGTETGSSDDVTSSKTLREKLSQPATGFTGQLSQARTASRTKLAAAEQRINDRVTEARNTIDAGVKRAGAKLSKIANDGLKQIERSVQQVKDTAAKAAPKKVASEKAAPKKDDQAKTE
ncbi:hypothetical protein [Mycolicibacterium fallax]|uniref:hypothetical protein n=1 Tax=Mycolicibacterium fallax TaxID=1793 RepID=UPI0013CFD3B5|nr:hypothetical protein [Mycolicibacterium fallax]